jgi:hypothetical protein
MHERPSRVKYGNVSEAPLARVATTTSKTPKKMFQNRDTQKLFCAYIFLPIDFNFIDGLKFFLVFKTESH